MPRIVELLPVRDRRYDDYALRRVREEIGRRMDRNDTFSTSASPILVGIR